jgi:hypothetical protein
MLRASWDKNSSPAIGNPSPGIFWTQIGLLGHKKILIFTLRSFFSHSIFVMNAHNDKYQRPKRQTRIILYPKDVVGFAGCHIQTARRMLNDVRLAFGKSPAGLVTIKEFCTVFEVKEEAIERFLNK